MILKHHDSREKDILVLKELLAYQLSPKQRFLIEREIDAIQKGERGENDSAYYINFHFGDSKNWIVIHDLRIELEDRAAQIDHILINRIFDIYVLESKNYKYGVRITETGEFEAYYNGKYIGIPSPIEQNKRHIDLLSQFIRHYDLLPKRLAIQVAPKYYNYVLLSPDAIIRRPKPDRFDSSSVIKADALFTAIKGEIDQRSGLNMLSSITKLSSFSTVEEFARNLVSHHAPIEIDWKRKFGIDETFKRDEKLERPPKKSKFFCARCRADISERVARFCWNNKKRFGGRAYCFNCQKHYV